MWEDRSGKRRPARRTHSCASSPPRLPHEGAQPPCLAWQVTGLASRPRVRPRPVGGRSDLSAGELRVGVARGLNLYAGISIRRGRTPDAATLATTASQKNHRPLGDDFSVKGPAGDSRLSPPKSTVRETETREEQPGIFLYVVVLGWSTVEFGVCSCGVSSEIKVLEY